MTELVPPTDSLLITGKDTEATTKQIVVMGTKSVKDPDFYSGYPKKVLQRDLFEVLQQDRHLRCKPLVYRMQF